MAMAKDVSVIIPSRNEIWLERTVDDILANAEMDTEVIAILDGYWPDPPIADRKKVVFIHVTEPVGQRGGTNLGARASEARFVMKADAHCAFDKGFDRKLIESWEPGQTVIPQQWALHIFDWKCKRCGNQTYQGFVPQKCEKCGVTDRTAFEQVIIWKPRRRHHTESWLFDHTLHFQYWRGDRRPERQRKVFDTVSLIGACWFTSRERYFETEGLDEAHGFWGQVGTEIACKAWLSGGRLVTNTSTWYAHLFRTGNFSENGSSTFPYFISGNAQDRAREYSRDLWFNNKWHKQIYPLYWLIERFKPLPYWHQPEVPGSVEALARVEEVGRAFCGGCTENCGACVRTTRRTR
jgi:glycosyltransferase involved in cell wall biosynthesis